MPLGTLSKDQNLNPKRYIAHVWRAQHKKKVFHKPFLKIIIGHLNCILILNLCTDGLLFLPSKVLREARVDHRVHARVDPSEPRHHLKSDLYFFFVFENSRLVT